MRRGLGRQGFARSRVSEPAARHRDRLEAPRIGSHGIPSHHGLPSCRSERPQLWRLPDDLASLSIRTSSGDPSAVPRASGALAGSRRSAPCGASHLSLTRKPIRGFPNVSESTRPDSPSGAPRITAMGLPFCVQERQTGTSAGHYAELSPNGPVIVEKRQRRRIARQHAK